MVTTQNTHNDVQQVLSITLCLNITVAISKIILGMMTGALAIMADGFHSLTDGAGNIAGLIGNHYASRPADDNHPYGHQRFETLAALLIGALLLLTAWETIQGIFERLQDATLPQLSPLVFLVLIATLIINILVSHYQIREGERLNSAILLADAENTKADVFVTLAVLISSGLVMLTGWVWIDLLAALIVVGLIGKAAWSILMQTGLVLVDTAPYEADELHPLVAEIQADVIRTRSRGTRDAAHIDIDVRVPPEMTTDQTNSIAYAIRQQLQQNLEGLEAVNVHFVPHHPNGRDTVLTARAYADALGLSTHEVQVSHDAQGCLLEMHVEVPANQTLAEAHTLVSALEADVTHAFPEIDRIVTHIEPKLEPIISEASNEDVLEIEAQILTILDTHYAHVGWHDTRLQATPHGYALSIHATLPASISVEAAHTVAESAETTLRAQLPKLQRVTIHTEPYDH
ncbi:MAG: cation diffusion facilitator family transporter [Chloroflexota bacterium]